VAHIQPWFLWWKILGCMCKHWRGWSKCGAFRAIPTREWYRGHFWWM